MNRQSRSEHREESSFAFRTGGMPPWLPLRHSSLLSKPLRSPLSLRGMAEMQSDFPRAIISVIVPTRGRLALLNRCLAALVEQTQDPSSYDIVVVDDAPSAETQSLTMSWAARTLGRGPVVGYLANKDARGSAAARNLGWRSACGEVIAFTDDDAVPDCNWLRNGLKAFTRGIHAAGGSVVTPGWDSSADDARGAKYLGEPGFLSANCFCLKSVLEELGGFDTRFRHASREDSDFYFRLLARKARIVHVPEAVVVHPRAAAWATSVRQQKTLLFDALLYKKHPKLYRQKIRASARWDYYTVTACLGVIPAALAAGLPLLAAGAAAIWMGMTGVSFARRLRATSGLPRDIAEIAATSALVPPVAVFWRLVGAIRFRSPLF